MPPDVQETWDKWCRRLPELWKIISRTLAHDLDNGILFTVLAQAEVLVNLRPSTFVCLDAGELVLLTPAHFLVGRKLTS